LSRPSKSSLGLFQLQPLSWKFHPKSFQPS
jgi:hypothetical protein